MIAEYVKFAIKTFKGSKTRSWLTMLGIFIGIAAVVSLISLGQGLQLAITQQFEDMGTDKIIIMPGSGVAGFGTATATELSEKDVDAVRKVKGVRYVSGWLYKMAKVEHNKKVSYVWIMSIPLDTDSKRLVESIHSVEVAEGRDLKAGDKYKALVGFLLAKEEGRFGKKIGIADTIKIEGQDFKVVGYLDRIGNPEDDTSIFIPIETAREVLDEPTEQSMILAQVQPGSNPPDVAEDIEKALRKSRDLKEGEEDFTVQTAEDLLRSYGSILTIVQLVVIGIAMISLVVGGIGIMNTMYTSVLERTQEIGVMKAIGARNSDITAIFLIESGLLGLAGGVIGVLLGMGFSTLVEMGAVAANVTILQATFPWYLIAGALAFSFIVGTIFGTLPALQAARLKPVDALRYE